MKKVVLNAINEHKKGIENFEKNSLSIVMEIVDMITSCIRQSGTVYLCGNGGSAADCQHIAGEFVGRFRAERKPLPAIAFSTDTSVITCIGNDYSFEDIFLRQAEAHIKKGDILWAFSTSGTSVNIIKAAQKAREKNANVIAFTGKPDSELEKISDFCLCADTPYTSTSQEVHMLAYHIICNLIDIEVTGGNIL